jgi:hypothetical protein
MECNLGLQHRTTIRTGLPSVTWGQLYRGIPQSKSETAQVDDTTGFVEALSTVDKRLIDLGGAAGNNVRLTEAQAFLEAMSQEAAFHIFYGNSATDPERFTGLAPRFSDPAAPNGGQLVNAAGNADANTSIWFVTWGDRQCHLLYPQGTKAGIAREDKGQQRVLDGDGNPYYALEELFRWHLGLTVRDWRYVSRICNIDIDALNGGSLDIYGLMRQAFWKIKRHNVPGARQAIYCNADVMAALDAAATPTTTTHPTADTVRLTPDNVEGKMVMSYRGIPIRQCDAILNTEEDIAFA